MEAGQLNKHKPVVAAIIQARMCSTRLPGKILLPLPFDSDKPLIGWAIETLKKIPVIDRIIIATSSSDEDSILKKLADQYSVNYFQGNEEDVLSRFVTASKEYSLDVVVRITADNPIIDDKLIEELINVHIKSDNDYTYSTNLPLGMNIEIVNASALITIYEKHTLTPADKEHVTLYLKQKNNHLFSVVRHAFQNCDLPENIRMTVDYASDYAAFNIITQVANHSGKTGIELVQYINKNYSWVWQINNDAYQKKQYISFAEEFGDAAALLRRHDMLFSEKILTKVLNDKNYS